MLQAYWPCTCKCIKLLMQGRPPADAATAHMARTWLRCRHRKATFYSRPARDTACQSRMPRGAAAAVVWGRLPRAGVVGHTYDTAHHAAAPHTTWCWNPASTALQAIYTNTCSLSFCCSTSTALAHPWEAALASDFESWTVCPSRGQWSDICNCGCLATAVSLTTCMLVPACTGNE